MLKVLLPWFLVGCSAVSVPQQSSSSSNDQSTGTDEQAARANDREPDRPSDGETIPGYLSTKIDGTRPVEIEFEFIRFNFAAGSTKSLTLDLKLLPGTLLEGAKATTAPFAMLLHAGDFVQAPKDYLVAPFVVAIQFPTRKGIDHAVIAKKAPDGELCVIPDERLTKTDEVDERQWVFEWLETYSLFQVVAADAVASLASCAKAAASLPIPLALAKGPFTFSGTDKPRLFVNSENVSLPDQSFSICFRFAADVDAAPTKQWLLDKRERSGQHNDLSPLRCRLAANDLVCEAHYRNKASGESKPYSVRSKGSVKDGKEHSACYVRAEGSLSLFVDGVATDGLPLDVDMPWGDQPIWIGGAFSDEFPFHGVIKDLRLFGVALSATEVAALYRKTP